MIGLIILEALRTVNLILEGIPVEERQKNYLAFVAFLESLKANAISPEAVLQAIVDFVNKLVKEQ